MAETPTSLHLLTAVEKRLDERLDLIEQMFKQSMEAMKELHEIRFSNMDKKIDDIRGKLCNYGEKEAELQKEKRKNKLQIILFVIGWLLTIGTVGVNYYHPTFAEDNNSLVSPPTASLTSPVNPIIQ